MNPVTFKKGDRVIRVHRGGGMARGTKCTVEGEIGVCSIPYLIFKGYPDHAFYAAEYFKLLITCKVK